MAIKQNINLYNFYTYSKERFFVKLSFFYYVNIAFIIILLSIYSYKNFKYFSMKSTYTTIMLEEEKLDLSVKRKALRVNELTTSDTDRQYLKDQQSAILQRQRMLNILKDNQDPVRFSKFLKELETSHQPGMQIRKVNIKNYGQDIDFQGLTVSSDTVASWLSLLKSQNSYKSAKFAAISMERDLDSSLLIFEVKSLYE